LQILVHRLRSFGQFSQIQRTDAMTANQNPKTTAASNTLKGSLRELGLFPKESNVATVKMKATEEPYFQRLLTGADENFRCTLTLPEKIVPTLGLAIGRVLDLEPVLAILTIHSGLALGDNSFEVPSADFRKQLLSCATTARSVTQITINRASLQKQFFLADESGLNRLLQCKGNGIGPAETPRLEFGSAGLELETIRRKHNVYREGQGRWEILHRRNRGCGITAATHTRWNLANAI
jgi:hypothetical protein